MVRARKEVIKGEIPGARDCDSGCAQHHYPCLRADLTSSMRSKQETWGDKDAKPSSCINLHLDSVRRAAVRSSTVVTAGGEGQRTRHPWSTRSLSKEWNHQVQGYVEHRRCRTGINLTVLELDLQLFSPVAWTPL